MVRFFLNRFFLNYSMAFNSTVLFDNSSISLPDHDVAFAVVYSFIIVIGIPANCVIITIVRKTPSMHTTTNYLLLNLAIADLLTLILCPGSYEYLLTKAHFDKTIGDFVCKVFAGNAFIPITMNAAALTVSTIAVERYLALVRPFETGLRLTKKQLPYVVALLWTLSVSSCIPDLLSNTVDSNPHSGYPCKRPWRVDEYSHHEGFITFTSIVFGIVPTVLVIFCYFELFRGFFITHTICAAALQGSGNQVSAEHRSKRQLFMLLLWVMLLFCVCTLPFSLFFIYLTTIDEETAASDRPRLFLIHRTVRFLLIANSFCNPLIYAFQSSNYRQGFKRIFSSKLFPRRKARKHKHNRDSNEFSPANCFPREMQDNTKISP